METNYIYQFVLIIWLFNVFYFYSYLKHKFYYTPFLCSLRCLTRVLCAKPERTSISFLHSGQMTTRFADIVLLIAITWLRVIKLAVVTTHLFAVCLAVIGEL